MQDPDPDDAPAAELGADELAVLAIESSPDVVVVYDRDRRARIVSDGTCEVVGLAREQILGRTALEIVGEAPPVQRIRETLEVLHEMIGLAVEHGLAHADDDASRITSGGGSQATSVRLRPLRRDGEVVGAYLSARDLGGTSSLMFRQAAVGMAHVNRHGSVREVNDALLSLVLTPREDVLGRPFADLLHPDDAASAAAFLEEVAQHDDPASQIELRVRRGGEARWVLMSAAPHRVGDAEEAGACVIMQDITDRVRLQRDLEQARRRLEALALRDHLTGLPNRAFLADRLSTAQETAAVDGSHTAVLFVDLDRFKLVNDSGGHAVGDLLLQMAAQRITSLLRPEDFAARLGGDEFIIGCTALDPDPAVAAEDAATIAGRIADAMASPFELAGRRWQIGASIGIALSRAGAATPQELLRDADADMYRVKAARLGD